MLFWFSILLILSLPMYSSPISLGAILVLTSSTFVGMMALYSSWWYSYILFLVYIGGLLVLFIYVCLISSNYPFFGSAELIMLSFISSGLTYLISIKPYSKSFLGPSLFNMGEMLVNNFFLWVFVGLAVLLLILLLVVVRSSGAGAISIK
uniref:NADH dehydrogenase subunit 6 n=1 Tax=Camachoaglaja africana TaxID=2083241 RepID=Q8HJW8_9GAST|nr:NADH dehydrogenase subunit 6 [Camachoaglaja africana]